MYCGAKAEFTQSLHKVRHRYLSWLKAYGQIAGAGPARGERFASGDGIQYDICLKTQLPHSTY
jgi:hypothetical protein